MRQGNKVALVIGCSYKDNHQNIPALNGTLNDAQNMVKLLTKIGYNVTFMTDAAVKSSPLYPNRFNIQNAFISLLQSTQSGDDVVIFFAGHGTQILSSVMKIGDEMVNTLQYDSDGKDEAIVPVDVTYAQGEINKDTLIIDDTLRYWLQQYGKKDVRIFLMFDCCHSGTMCDLQYSYSCPDNIADVGVSSNTINVNDIKNKLTTEEIVGAPNNNAIQATVITLSACKDSEVSWEEYVQLGDMSGKESQGLLTRSFIYNVQTAANTTKDIFKLLYCIAMQTSNHKPFGQRPKITSSVPLHNPSNDNNRYILNGASVFDTNTNTDTDTNTDTNTNANIIIVPDPAPHVVQPKIQHTVQPKIQHTVQPKIQHTIRPKVYPIIRPPANNPLFGSGMSTITSPHKEQPVISNDKQYPKPIRFTSLSPMGMTKYLL
jgi:hypothetical protein